MVCMRVEGELGCVVEGAGRGGGRGCGSRYRVRWGI